MASMRVTNAPGSVLQAASLARLGRMNEAAQAFARVRHARPSLQRPMAAPYLNPADLEHLRDGFRMAGTGRGSEGKTSGEDATP